MLNRKRPKLNLRCGLNVDKVKTYNLQGKVNARVQVERDRKSYFGCLVFAMQARHVSSSHPDGVMCLLSHVDGPNAGPGPQI